MFNIRVEKTNLEEVKIIKFDRFNDLRGYFTEPFRKSDLVALPQFEHLKDLDIKQMNESYSIKHVIRGLHFQYDPYMYKFFKPALGKVIAVAVDARKNSPTLGKGTMQILETKFEDKEDTWFYSPPGFALGFLTLEDSMVQYLIAGEYNQSGEVQISPVTKDIDFSEADQRIVKQYFEIAETTKLLSDKDKVAMSFTDWTNDKRISNFNYEDIKTV